MTCRGSKWWRQDRQSQPVNGFNIFSFEVNLMWFMSMNSLYVNNNNNHNSPYWGENCYYFKVKTSMLISVGFFFFFLLIIHLDVFTHFLNSVRLFSSFISLGLVSPYPPGCCQAAQIIFFFKKKKRSKSFTKCNVLVLSHEESGWWMNTWRQLSDKPVWNGVITANSVVFGWVGFFWVFFFIHFTCSNVRWTVGGARVP